MYCIFLVSQNMLGGSSTPYTVIFRKPLLGCEKIIEEGLVECYIFFFVAYEL